MFTEMGGQRDSGLGDDGGRVRRASRGPKGTLIWASHSSQPEARGRGRGRGLEVEKKGRSLGMQLVSAPTWRRASSWARLSAPLTPQTWDQDSAIRPKSEFSRSL